MPETVVGVLVGLIIACVLLFAGYWIGRQHTLHSIFIGAANYMLIDDDDCGCCGPPPQPMPPTQETWPDDDDDGEAWKRK